MPTNVLFLYNNLLDAASSITASSEDSDYPASNVQNDLRKRVWKTEAGNANLVIDHGSAKAVTCVALIDYDWTAAPGTLDYELHTADAWGAPDNTEALTYRANPDTYGNKGSIIKTFSSISKRYNRLNVAYGSIWQLGRIFCGTYFEPSNNFAIEYTLDYLTPSRSSNALGGQRYVDEIEKKRTAELNFFVESYSEWQNFQAVINTIGIDNPFFISLDYDNYPGELTMYGHIESTSHSYDYHHHVHIVFIEDV